MEMFNVLTPYRATIKRKCKFFYTVMPSEISLCVICQEFAEFCQEFAEKELCSYSYM